MKICACGWLAGVVKGKCSASDVEQVSGEYITRLNQYQSYPVVKGPSELVVLNSSEFKRCLSPF